MSRYEPVPPFGVQLDLEELRRPILRQMSLLALGIAWIWIAITGIPKEGVPPLRSFLPPVIIALTSAVSLLARAKPIALRSALLLLGIGSTLVWCYASSQSPIWLCYSTLLVSMAAVLSGPRLLLGVAAIISATVLTMTDWNSTSTTQLTALPFLGLIWAIAACSWLSQRNLYTALHWAFESQSRAWDAAREARERRGALRRALDSLRLTQGILERTLQELEMARREAEEARQVKSRFVANVSHELRTPLNIIVGFAELLCTAPETYGEFAWPPTLREDLLTIWRNAEHLLSMVDDVLDLAQIEARALPILPEPTDIVQLVRETLLTAHVLLENSHLELRIALPPSGVILQVDATRIRQVLLNLLNNAVRFTSQGYIEVGGFQTETEFTVYVRDSGEGIPEDKLEKIFEEFEQADTSIRRPHQGAGLGLAICRHFISMHGGRIWAESKLGSGSTFFFSLPLTESTVARTRKLTRTPHRRPTSQRGKHIVVLCKDALTLRILQRYIQTMEVLITESMCEAKALIEECHPQAVLVATSSVEALSSAMEQAEGLADSLAPYDLPIMVCNFPTERRAGAALGVDEMLIKPVTHRDVVSTMKRLCEHPRRVLIVEDEIDMLRLLKRIVLQEWPKAEVLTTTSGSEAIDMLTQHPDILLLDLLVPHVSGPQILDTLRSRPDTRNTPVVVITARGQPEGQVDSNGRNNVLKRSSFTAEELIRCLQTLAENLPPRYVASATTWSGIPKAVPA